MTSSDITTKGDGHYNKNSLIQLSIIESTIPFIQLAIESYEGDITSVPFIVADYGSSQGENSILAMKTIIDSLYNKYSKTKLESSLLIIHNDLPSNDWITLFNSINSNNEYNCYSLASGKSFYEQCLPKGSLHIGYSSSALHWLSKRPCDLLTDCEQAKQDYENFLLSRSNELQPGGILILAVFSRNDNNDYGHKSTNDLFYECMVELLNENKIIYDELIDCKIPAYRRTYNECVDNDLFAKLNLKLIHSKFTKLSSILYQKYKQNALTLDEFCKKQTQFVMSVGESILKYALNKRTSNEIDLILELFWNKYENGIRKRPDEHNFEAYQTYLIFKKLERKI